MLKKPRKQVEMKVLKQTSWTLDKFNLALMLARSSVWNGNSNAGDSPFILFYPCSGDCREKHCGTS